MHIFCMWQDAGGPDGSSSSRQSVTEVLIKLIRVIANLSISEDVGSNLCDNKKCVEYLLHIIGECETCCSVKFPRTQCFIAPVFHVHYESIDLL